MLNEFESMTANPKKVGIGNIVHIKYPECNICFEKIKKLSQKKAYLCKKHFGHKKCVNRYMKSN